MGADMENPDAGDYVPVTTTEPNKELNKWFYRLVYSCIFGFVICFHYMLVFDPASFRMVVVTNMCGHLLYCCSFIVIYKYVPPKRTGADLENPDAGDYVAVTPTEPKKELNKWIHRLMCCFVFANIIYVDYKLVKLDPASLGLTVVIELCWLLVSCCNSVLLYKSQELPSKKFQVVAIA